MKTDAKTTTQTKLFYNKFYQFLLTFLAVMLMSAGFGNTAVGQEKEAYFTYNGASLKFYYDDRISEIKLNFPSYVVETFDLNNVSENPVWPWAEYKTSVSNVWFDDSFKEAHPKSYKNWFKDFAKLNRVYATINISEAVSLSGMFEGCSNIDAAYFTGSSSKITDVSNLFKGCENISIIHFENEDDWNISSLLGTDKVSGIFDGCTNLSRNTQRKVLGQEELSFNVTIPAYTHFTGYKLFGKSTTTLNTTEHTKSFPDQTTVYFDFDEEDINIYINYLPFRDKDGNELTIGYDFMVDNADFYIASYYKVEFMTDKFGICKYNNTEPYSINTQYVLEGEILPNFVVSADTWYDNMYVFDGWYTDPNYADGTKWNQEENKVTKDIKLYPKFRRIKYTFTTEFDDVILLRSTTLNNVTIGESMKITRAKDGDDDMYVYYPSTCYVGGECTENKNITFEPHINWLIDDNYKQGIVSYTNRNSGNLEDGTYTLTLNYLDGYGTSETAKDIPVTIKSISAKVNGVDYNLEKTPKITYRLPVTITLDLPSTKHDDGNGVGAPYQLSHNENKYADKYTVGNNQYTFTFDKTNAKDGENSLIVDYSSFAYYPYNNDLMYNYMRLEKYIINIELPYTITFSPNGHGTAPEEQSVYEGEKATKPSDLTENGWFFTGKWYTEADCQNEWNFSESTVSANTTLYAQWERVTHTVTFIDGTYSSSTSVNHGDKVATPNLNNKEGYTLSWTLNEKEYDFTQPVTEDITLKALWTANEKTITPIISVTLESTTIKYPLDHDKYCNNQEPSAIIHYSVDEKSTQPTHYSITFDNTSIPEQNGEINNIGTIEIPMIGIPTGEFAATIKFTNDTENAQPSEAKFTLYAAIPPDVILKLYHNVIFANNHDSLYNKYQWRKDGKDIAGATKQYYTERPELTGNISVLLTPFVGDPIETCPFPTGVSVKKLASNIKVYPNPATAGKEFKVEILDFADDNDYKLLIFSNEGALVKTVTTRERITEVSLPRGIFTIALTANGEKCGYFKIIVEK